MHCPRQVEFSECSLYATHFHAKSAGVSALYCTVLQNLAENDTMAVLQMEGEVKLSQSSKTLSPWALPALCLAELPFLNPLGQHHC